jgi:hypothetical protein
MGLLSFVNIQVDDYMRAWCNMNGTFGLLFTCRRGEVQEPPVALLQLPAGVRQDPDHWDIIPTGAQVREQHEQVLISTGTLN